MILYHFISPKQHHILYDTSSCKFQVSGNKLLQFQKELLGDSGGGMQEQFAICG